MAKDKTLKKMYSKLEGHREQYLSRAKDASALTLPFIMPPSGSKDQTLNNPYQSLGPRLVNNLASKLLLTQFPPNSPFFRYEVSDTVMERLQAPRAAIEEGLSSMERAINNEVEQASMRVPLFEALRHLIVTGNCLLTYQNSRLRVFHLDQYVCERDPDGFPLRTIIKESITKDVFEDRFGHAPPEDRSAGGNTKSKQHLDLYTMVRYEASRGRYVVTQEINETSIGKGGSFPVDKVPFIVLRWNAIDGENYGRGLVEEYIGDLETYEGLSKAILQYAAAASKVVFLVSPNSAINPAQLFRTPNLGALSGEIDDVGVLQLQKFGDLRVAVDTATTLEQRLAASFLLNQSVQRDAERVTAEEIRFLANELESALGGIYSLLSHELQLPLVRLIELDLQQRKELPVLPEGSLNPVIVTGFEALGRSNDSNKIAMFIGAVAQTLGPEAALRWFNQEEVIRRIGAGFAIDLKDIIRSGEEVQQEMAKEKQEMQQAMMVDKGLAPAINQGGQMIQQNLKQ